MLTQEDHQYLDKRRGSWMQNAMIAAGCLISALGMAVVIFLYPVIAREESIVEKNKVHLQNVMRQIETKSDTEGELKKIVESVTASDENISERLINLNKFLTLALLLSLLLCTDAILGLRRERLMLVSISSKMRESGSVDGLTKREALFVKKRERKWAHNFQLILGSIPIAIGLAGVLWSHLILSDSASFVEKDGSNRQRMLQKMTIATNVRPASEAVAVTKSNVESAIERIVVSETEFAVATILRFISLLKLLAITSFLAIFFSAELRLLIYYETKSFRDVFAKLKLAQNIST